MSRPAPTGPLARWREAWHAAPSKLIALRWAAEYAALRIWGLVIGCFPVELNLASARLLGRLWWRLIPRHRDRALEHLRSALPECSEAQRRRIAQGSFEHFAQLYLVELALTPRLVHLWSWARYVELGELGPALRALLSGSGVILLTGHFGNYELLGFTIARLGIPLVAVMRPLDNPLVNDYLLSSREAGGLSLLYKKGATASATDVLESGGALCFIADQNAGRKGVFVDFFGRKAATYKSIALLAMQHRVPVIVGSAVRVREGFCYRIDVQRVIQPPEWDAQDDPLTWLTQAYTAGLEAAIRRQPEQYLWIHRRWKTRPKEEQAGRAAEAGR